MIMPAYNVTRELVDEIVSKLKIAIMSVAAELGL